MTNSKNDPIVEESDSITNKHRLKFEDIDNFLEIAEKIVKYYFDNQEKFDNLDDFFHNLENVDDFFDNTNEILKIYRNNKNKFDNIDDFKTILKGMIKFYDKSLSFNYDEAEKRKKQIMFIDSNYSELIYFGEDDLVKKSQKSFKNWLIKIFKS